MTQLGRNLTDTDDGFLRGAQYLILDRDPLYTTAFRRLLRDSGVTPLVLPAWSSKSECLDRMVLLGRTAPPRCGPRVHGSLP